MKKNTDDQVNELGRECAISQYGNEHHEEFVPTVNGFIMGYNEACKLMDTNTSEVNLDEKERSDIRRGLIFSMQQLDLTKNIADRKLSNRLEVIIKKFE